MGRGSKHSKNAGVMGSEALSYAERKALGYGTVKERLGKVSQEQYLSIESGPDFACYRETGDREHTLLDK